VQTQPFQLLTPRRSGAGPRNVGLGPPIRRCPATDRRVPPAAPVIATSDRPGRHRAGIPCGFEDGDGDRTDVPGSPARPVLRRQEESPSDRFPGQWPHRSRRRLTVSPSATWSSSLSLVGLTATAPATALAPRGQPAGPVGLVHAGVGLERLSQTQQLDRVPHRLAGHPRQPVGRRSLSGCLMAVGCSRPSGGQRLAGGAEEFCPGEPGHP